MFDALTPVVDQDIDDRVGHGGVDLARGSTHALPLAPSLYSWFGPPAALGPRRGASVDLPWIPITSPHSTRIAHLQGQEIRSPGSAGSALGVSRAFPTCSMRQLRSSSSPCYLWKYQQRTSVSWRTTCCSSYPARDWRPSSSVQIPALMITRREDRLGAPASQSCHRQDAGREPRRSGCQGLTLTQSSGKRFRVRSGNKS